ncbi:MAG: hypothetical protein IJI14_16130 [Anaerolineaceae bacterium]|nr:hypothetical protein [Anaerolineaceae bacterium]
MKKIALLILLLIVAFCCVMSAAAEDTYFTCDSDPADFNGKTFGGDLYVLLNGCTNFKSTVIPENNAFVTLRDVEVKGTLYFTDGKYDSAAEVYKEAGIWDNATTANHYLNLAGDSYIENLYMECMDPHTCNLGIQYTTTVNNMDIVPTSSAARSKIVVRGYIDPFIDEATDYYNDTDVAAFPEFDIKTFDKNFALPILEKHKIFIREALTKAYNGVRCGDNGITREVFHEHFDEQYPYPAEVAATSVYLDRGTINNLNIYNKYLIGAGEVSIDLINLCVKIMRVTNGKTVDSTTATDFVRMWVPVLRGGGLTNIGVLSAFSQLKTDVIEEDFKTAPLYIDVLAVGTEGLTEKISLASTKVAMLHYMGGLSPYSRLELTFVPPDNQTVATQHIPSVGILMAHGGYINPVSKQYYSYPFYIGAFWLFNGREDLRYGTDVNGIATPAGFTELPFFYDGLDPDVLTEEEIDEARVDIYRTYAGEYHYDYENIYYYTKTFGTTEYGAIWIANVLDKYATPAPEEVKQASTTKIYLGSVSFGDLHVDQALSDIVGNKWFSASCAVHQYGEQASAAPKIIHVLR